MPPTGPGAAPVRSYADAQTPKTPAPHGTSSTMALPPICRSPEPRRPMRTPRQPHEPESPKPSAMDTVRLRRLNRWQAEGLREDLADLYVESTTTPPGEEFRGRQEFLRRLADGVKRPGFDMLVAEARSLTGCVFGVPVPRDGSWWQGFGGPLPQNLEQLTASGHVFAILETVVHPHQYAVGSPVGSRSACSTTIKPPSGSPCRTGPTARPAPPWRRGAGRRWARSTVPRPSCAYCFCPSESARGSIRTASRTMTGPNGPDSRPPRRATRAKTPAENGSAPTEIGSAPARQWYRNHGTTGRPRRTPAPARHMPAADPSPDTVFGAPQWGLRPSGPA